MDSISTATAGAVVAGAARCIHENREYLSTIDGLIGDGDHGYNMDKGACIYLSRKGEAGEDLQENLKLLSRVLLNEIGGSMGPLYGTFFGRMARNAKGRDTLDLALFSQMLAAALEGIQSIGGAQVGDKTLVDTLSPAVESLKKSAEAGEGFKEALDKMEVSAEAGKESTKDLVAKLGRASRLGERSRGVLDAGAASCCLILKAMSQEIKALLKSNG